MENFGILVNVFLGFYFILLPKKKKVFSCDIMVKICFLFQKMFCVLRCLYINVFLLRI
jgi:hypothetical protein